MISKLSPLFIVLAGCLWGSMGIFVRRLNDAGIQSMSIVFIRALFTAAITFALTALRNKELLKIKLRDIWIFAGTGLISIVLFNFCYFTAISMMSLSAAAILLYTSPIFVMLLSAMIYKERITVQKVIAVVLSLAGLSLVTGVFGGARLTPMGIVFGLLSAFGYANSAVVSVTPSGVLYGLGSALGYAMYSIFGRAAINRGYGSLTTTAWSFAFAALFSAFFADYGAIFGAVSDSALIIPYTVVFAIVASVAPYVLYSLGLRGTETGKAAVIASVEPIAASLFGIILYHEIPTVQSVFGILLVLAALAMCIITPKKHNRSD